MYDLIIDNAIVMTPDKKWKPFLGSICVDDGVIVKVSPPGKRTTEAGQYIDAAGKILMPGLVNAHCHGDMAFAKGLGDGMTLREQMDRFSDTNWFFSVIDDDDRYYSRQHTYIEALLGGTTCIMENMFWSLGTRSVDAVKEIGIRAALAEDIRYDFADPEALMPKDMLDQFRKQCVDNGLIPVLGSISEEDFNEGMLEAVAGLTKQIDCRVTCHLAETTWRIDLVRNNMGKSPVEALLDFGLVDEKLVASHGVWLSETDIVAMAEKGASVVSTPLCELKISDGLAPIPEMLKAGLNVALGTDGAMWNNSNDMFREMKCTALAHNIRLGPKAIEPKQVLDMATINGAIALGLEHEIGSIEAGKKADVILVDATAPHMRPIRMGQGENVSSALVYCATGADVTDVFVNGRHLIQNHCLPHIDVAGIEKKLDQASQKTIL